MTHGSRLLCDNYADSKAENKVKPGVKHLMGAIICHCMCAQFGIVVFMIRDIYWFVLAFHSGVFLSRTVRHFPIWLPYMSGATISFVNYVVWNMRCATRMFRGVPPDRHWCPEV